MCEVTQTRRTRIAEGARLSALPSAVPILSLLCFVFSFTADRFLSMENFSNILLNGSVLSIAALGMSIVMLTNGIDLSVGATISL